MNTNTKNALLLGYSAIAYSLGMASLAYLAGFLADFGVPKGINDGDVRPVWTSISVNVCLVLGFGLHHSLTARTSFKEWWTTWVPQPIERATYVLMTSAAIVCPGYVMATDPGHHLASRQCRGNDSAARSLSGHLVDDADGDRSIWPLSISSGCDRHGTVFDAARPRQCHLPRGICTRW